MGEYRDPVQPFRMVAIDFIGPFPTSKSGNKFLLVIVYIFSKYVIIKAIRKSTAAITIDRIEGELFLKFGVPEILISDNGPQLTSALFIDFLDEFGVRHWLTANYHPQANPTEAANKTIGNAIRAHVKQNEKHNSWDEHIEEIAFALNSAVHSTTKFSPHQVVFGKTLLANGMDHDEKFREAANHAPTCHKTIKLVAERVAENLRASYENNRKRYNLRTRDIEYRPNERIFRRNTKLSDLIIVILRKWH